MGAAEAAEKTNPTLAAVTVAIIKDRILCISLDSSSGPRLMQCSDRGSRMVNFWRALELSEIAQYRAANVLKAGMLASFRQRKAARTSPAPAEQRRPR